MLSLAAVLGLGLVGGCVALDRTAFLQSSVARPLVGATLAAGVLGVPSLGLWCGVFLELLWLTDAPMGAALPPDDAVAGVLSVAVAWAAPDTWIPDARAALGVVVAVPGAYVSRWVDTKVRHWNGDLVARARDALDRGDALGVGRVHLLGSTRFFAAGAVTTVALCSGAVAGVRAGVPLLPPETARGMELVALLMPILGAAAVMASWRGSRYAACFVGGTAAGAFGGRGLTWTR